MTTANQIADFLLCLAREHGDYLTNLKLQKLVYYSQAWHLAVFDEPLFDDDIQAWIHGPVVSHLYGRFKHCGFRPIDDETGRVPELRKDSANLVREVFQKYGRFSALDLEQMTHEELPWLEARAGISPEQNSSSVLRQDTMKSFFKAKLQGGQA